MSDMITPIDRELAFPTLMWVINDWLEENFGIHEYETTFNNSIKFNIDDINYEITCTSSMYEIIYKIYLGDNEELVHTCTSLDNLIEYFNKNIRQPRIKKSR